MLKANSFGRGWYAQQFRNFSCFFYNQSKNWMQLFFLSCIYRRQNGHKVVYYIPIFFFSFLGGGGIIPPIAKRINGLLCCYPMPYGDGRWDQGFFFFVCLNRNKYISFVIWNEPIVLSLLHSVVDRKGGVKPLFYFFLSCWVCTPFDPCAPARAPLLPPLNDR